MKRAIGIGVGLDDGRRRRRRRPDGAVAVDVVIEGEFELFERGIVARHYADRAGQIIAAAVGRPYGVLGQARIGPSHVIAAAGGLAGHDRAPAGKLPDGDRRAVLQLRAVGGAVGVQEIIAAGLGEIDRAIGIGVGLDDGRRRRRRRPDGAVAVDVVIEGEFELFERGIVARHYADRAGQIIAAAVGRPYGVLGQARIGP